MHFKANIRITISVGACQLRQQLKGCRTCESDGQLAKVAAGGFLAGFDGIVENGQHLCCPFVKHLTCLRQRYRSGRPDEQRHLYLALEATNLIRERRLRNVESTSCSGEVALIRDCDEVPHVSKLHVSPPPRESQTQCI